MSYHPPMCSAGAPISWWRAEGEIGRQYGSAVVGQPIPIPQCAFLERRRTREWQVPQNCVHVDAGSARGWLRATPNPAPDLFGGRNGRPSPAVGRRVRRPDTPYCPRARPPGRPWMPLPRESWGCRVRRATGCSQGRSRRSLRQHQLTTADPLPKRSSRRRRKVVGSAD